MMHQRLFIFGLLVSMAETAFARGGQIAVLFGAVLAIGFGFLFYLIGDKLIPSSSASDKGFIGFFVLIFGVAFFVWLLK